MVQLKKNQDIKNFIKNKNHKGLAVLIYGPDEGLAKERADTLCHTITETSNDPFSVVTLDESTITANPSKLLEESATISLFGDQRVIKVNAITDKTTDIAKELLKHSDLQNMVILVAGDLSKKSKLRALFEKSTSHISIACYQDDPKDIEFLLNERLANDSITIDQDARRWVLSHLGADRGTTRNEIEKISLYAGKGGVITLPMAMMLIGDNQALNISEMVYSAFEGNHPEIDRHYGHLMAEGTSPIAILRTITNHIVTLQLICATTQQEKKPVSAVINELRPPIFWKLKPRMEKQAKRWNPEKLSIILNLCLDIEQKTKQTDFPKDTMTNRLMHQIARMA